MDYILIKDDGCIRRNQEECLDRIVTCCTLLDIGLPAEEYRHKYLSIYHLLQLASRIFFSTREAAHAFARLVLILEIYLAPLHLIIVHKFNFFSMSSSFLLHSVPNC